MKFSKRINWFILVLPILIFTLGIVTLMSTSPDLARDQLIFFIVGCIVYFLVATTDFRILGYYWKPLYIFTVLLLIITFILGREVFGSTRWLQIGLFNLQPSEFAKLVVLIVTAFLISSNISSVSSVKGVLKTALYILPIFGLVFIQPDLGTSLVILFIFISLLWFGGANKMYFIVGVLLFGVFSSPVWGLLKDYQKERILVFLNPMLDSLGAGYNVIQSTIAVGSGGLLGRGFGRGTQSHLQFLPVFWTDFIFAAFAEEWGYIGVLILLVIYAALLISLLYVAMTVKDSFGSLIAVGAFVIFFFQFAINVGMNLGIMPVTGIPLPLVSHGGSSLITSAFLLGFVQSVWMHDRG